MGRVESNQTKLSRINGHQSQNIRYTNHLKYSSILVICVGNEQIKFTGSIFCKGALAIRRIFSLVEMITKPKFSNCPNVFKIGLFL